MSYKLKKPYTSKQRMDFIVRYNHQKGLKIEETQDVLYALEENEIMQNGIPIIDDEYEEKRKQKERDRISMLSLTAADVERAIYKAKGMDFEDIVGLVQKFNEQLETVKSDYAQRLAQYNELSPELKAEQEKPKEPEGAFIDIKALKIELKANNFYRGNPYVEQIGTLLGISAKQLDKFFEFNDYQYLLSE